MTTTMRTEHLKRLVSVCIPAHNEQTALPGTLQTWWRAISHPQFSHQYEVEFLLGANACTDATEKTFMECITGWPEIKNGGQVVGRVITTDRPGKVIAWNSLAAAAQGEILIFSDADILISPEAPMQLLLAFAEKETAAAGGVLLAPELPRMTALYRRLSVKMKEFATKPVPYLNGPLYALRAGTVTEIPEEIINEDTYLNLIIGAARIKTVKTAWGWQLPPSGLREYYHRQVRMRAGSQQLAEIYGKKYTIFRQKTADPRTRAARHRILTAAERRTKQLTFWVAWLQHLLDSRADREVAKMSATAGWHTCSWAAAESSKPDHQTTTWIESEKQGNV